MFQSKTSEHYKNIILNYNTYIVLKSWIAITIRNKRNVQRKESSVKAHIMNQQKFLKINLPSVEDSRDPYNLYIHKF